MPGEWADREIVPSDRQLFHLIYYHQHLLLLPIHPFISPCSHPSHDPLIPPSVHWRAVCVHCPSSSDWEGKTESALILVTKWGSQAPQDIPERWEPLRAWGWGPAGAPTLALRVDKSAVLWGVERKTRSVSNNTFTLHRRMLCYIVTYITQAYAMEHNGFIICKCLQ